MISRPIHWKQRCPDLRPNSSPQHGDAASCSLHIKLPCGSTISHPSVLAQLLSNPRVQQIMGWCGLSHVMAAMFAVFQGRSHMPSLRPSGFGTSVTVVPYVGNCCWLPGFRLGVLVSWLRPVEGASEVIPGASHVILRSLETENELLPSRRTFCLSVSTWSCPPPQGVASSGYGKEVYPCISTQARFFWDLKGPLQKRVSAKPPPSLAHPQGMGRWDLKKKPL